MMFTGCRAMSTSKGASGAVMASCDDEPMCRHTTVPSSSHAPPEGVPVVGVEARPAQLGGVLREGHGVASLGRHPPHLGRHELGVPDGRDGQGDEAARVGAAPVLDVPVVVGPQHVEGELLVLGPGEELAAELDEGGEAHRPEHAVDVHVPDPLVDVVATRAHLVEGGGLDAVLLGGPAHHGVEAHVGDHVALEGPDVDAVVVVDDPRGAVLPLGRDPAVEHVGGLDDVVVDAHEDEIFGLHRAASPSAWRQGDHIPDVRVRHTAAGGPTLRPDARRRAPGTGRDRPRRPRPCGAGVRRQADELR